MNSAKETKKRKFCELKSQVEKVKSLKVTDFIVIGRNKECEIRDRKCSRQMYEVNVRDDCVYITKLKTNETKLLQNDEIIEGNGFKYKVNIGDEYYQVDNVDELSEANEEGAGEWEQYESLYVYKYRGGGQSSSLLAAFDFDGTLVVTKSGKKFAINEFDWRLKDPKIVERIKDLIKRNYRFVIFSNQAGISSGSVSLQSVQKRFENAIKRINVPCTAMMATKNDIYRKPRPGMFWILQNMFNDAIEIEEKLMVGDAAGRKTSMTKDHSAADILFAFNLNFNSFQTPEDFLGDKTMDVASAIKTYSNKLPQFNPRSLDDHDDYIASNENGERFETIDDLMASLQSTNILFVGLPATGKSHFFDVHLSKRGYKEICRDKLGSMDKCEQRLKQLLNEGETKMVINNMNLEENTRRKYLQSIPNLVCFYFQSTREKCLHLNNYRRLMKQMDAMYEYSSVPDPVIYASEKRLIEPTKEEGFVSVYRISFIVDQSDLDKQQQLLFMYL